MTLCAFAFRKGIFMTNEEFALLSLEEKRSKVREAIKFKTEDRLMEEEVQSILLLISPERQYHICVHSDPAEFSHILNVQKPWVGRTVFGQVLMGTADVAGCLFCTERSAAVILRTLDDAVARELHIYIPPHYRKEKGYNNE